MRAFLCDTRTWGRGSAPLEGGHRPCRLSWDKKVVVSGLCHSRSFPGPLSDAAAGLLYLHQDTWFSILSISISFSILKFLSQSLLWICSSSFLLPLEYKSRSVLLPPIMCSSEVVFQVSLTYCVRPHHQRRVRRLSCRWRRLNQLTKGKWFCAKGEPPMTGSNLDACVTKNPFCLTQC